MSPEQTREPFVWTPTLTVRSEQLIFGMGSRAPVVLFLGKRGSGKTRMVEELLDTRLDDVSVAFLGDPRALAGVSRRTVEEVFTQLRSGTEDAPESTPILIVDDAHRLADKTIAGLLEVARSGASGDVAAKLLLVGRPELADRFQDTAPGVLALTVELNALPDDEAADFLGMWVKTRGIAAPDESRMKRCIRVAKGNIGALVSPFEKKAGGPDRNRTSSPLSIDPSPSASRRRNIDRAARRTTARSHEARSGPRPRYRRQTVIGASLLAMIVSGVSLVHADFPEDLPNIGDLASGFAPYATAPLPLLEIAEPFRLAAPAQLFQAGVNASVADDRAGLLHLARAALGGHARAAYFLGQIYDAGEGVRPSPSLALAWYGLAAEEFPRARARAETLLSETEGLSTSAPPEILQVAPTSDGQLHFIWNDPGAGRGTTYALEFAAEDRTPVETVISKLPAASVTAPSSSARVRLIATSGSDKRRTRWYALPG